MKEVSGKIAKAAVLLSYLTFAVAVVTRLAEVGTGPLSYRAWVVATGILLLMAIANNTLKEQ